MNRNLDSKLPDVGTSIFAVMTQLAVDTGAINLAQGYPDFGTDPELIRLMQEALQEGHNQYAPMAGLFSLREAIARLESSNLVERKPNVGARVITLSIEELHESFPELFEERGCEAPHVHRDRFVSP